MILQNEIREKASEWGVPPDTVDKDYVLGHFLSAFFEKYEDELIFKGGTCLRKCYLPNYRFSEDLDFTAKQNTFELTEKSLNEIIQIVNKHSNILFHPEEIVPLQHQNQKKGYQVKIKYWGANHSKNQAPPPPERWNTRIKLEISTEEICLLEPLQRKIHHPYGDALINNQEIPCYTIDEIVSEKLRSLEQRSYTAPRDFYDLYHLTNDFESSDWKKLKGLFLKKMKHKNLVFTNADDFVKNISTANVIKAWNASISHQIKEDNATAEYVIENVIQRIKENL